MDAQEMSFQNVVDTVLKPAGVKVGGYPDDIFLELGDDDRERWQCSICYLVSRQAKECDNGHMFCATCVFAWSMTYGANSDKCPVCRVKQTDYRPRAEIDESIGHKKVRCPEPACGFRAPLTYLLKHSHGAERFGNNGVDLESLRRSRPAPINPFLAGSGVIFLPLLRAPGGASGSGREGRSLLQDMMMVLHLEMELRRRAIERFSSEEDHVERVRHMTEVLAIQEQMQEITGFLNLLFSVTPQRRNDGVGQEGRQAEHRGLSSEALESDNEADDGDSSAESESSLSAVMLSRRAQMPDRSDAIAGSLPSSRRQLDLPESSGAAYPSSPAHVLAPVPPLAPRHAAVTPRGRWRGDDSQETARWPASNDLRLPAAASLAPTRNVRVPSPQPPPPSHQVPSSSSSSSQVAGSRPGLVPHPPHVSALPTDGLNLELSGASSSTSSSDSFAQSTPSSSQALPQRSSRMANEDSGRSGDWTIMTPSGSNTFQAALRQLPPISRAAASTSPAPRFPDIPTADPAPQRERTIFAPRNENNVPETSPHAEGSSHAASPPRGGVARRFIRRKKVANGLSDTPLRREPEPPSGGPVTRSRSQLGNTLAQRHGAGTGQGHSLQRSERPQPSRTRGIDFMHRAKDNSSQRH